MSKYVPRFVSRVSRFSILLLVLAFGIAFAQERKAEPSSQAPATATQEQPTQQKQPQQQPQPGINREFGEPLAQESQHAAGPREGAEKENDQEKMVQEMKESPSVRWMAEHLHISTGAGYWFGIILDFAILALLIGYALKKNLPTAFRSRSANIQRGIEEARKASADANRRLADIEARLSKMDEEVGAMRAAADQETAAEEQRILAAAEEDKKRIVDAAESEIAAAAKLARHELKAFTAELAVTLAAHRIHVDNATDEALVRKFTEQLGDSNAGKDGR